jgi:hypothetical protein
MSFRNTIAKVKRFEAIEILWKIPKNNHEIKKFYFNINNVCYF